MLLLVCLLWLCCLAALSGTGRGLVSCWPPAPESESCGAIQLEEWPDCRESWITIPDSCPYKDNYRRPAAEKPPRCTDTVFRNDCAVEVTEGNLSVTLHPLSHHEATITVSWGHLHNLIPAGSQLELRLINSEPCENLLGSGYLWRTHYDLCTNTSMPSSHTFPAVRYGDVNQVLLVVLSESVATSIYRTKFASTIGAFNCSNTNIIPFDIEFCRPERYGQVENLTAKMISGELALISWFPPVQHALYNDGLRYYLNVTAHSPDSNTQQHLFLISTDAREVSVGPLNSTSNYTIAVRAFADCGGCGQNTTTSLHIFPATTPSAPPPTATTATPTATPTSTTSTATHAGLNSTTPTDSLTMPLSLTLGVAGGAMLLLVIALLAAVACFTARLKRDPRVNVVSETSPAVLGPSYLESSGTPPLQSPETRPDRPGYIQLVSNSGSSRTVSDQPIHMQLTELGPELWDDSENTSEILPVVMEGERESSNEREEILSHRRTYTVLIVYRPCTGPVDSREKLLSLGLAKSLAPYGINPTCIDFVSMRQPPSRWLEETAPKMDAVLCVWTKEFRKDWDSLTYFTQTLRTVIEVKKMKHKDISNFASILLKKGDEEHIPDALCTNRHFMIDELQKIVAFVRDIPIPVHIRRHSHTSSGSSRVSSRDRPVAVEVTLDTSPSASAPREYTI